MAATCGTACQQASSASRHYSSGGMGANHALRQTFVYLNMPAMQQPEAYISNAGDLVDAEGKVINEKTGKILTDYMGAFAKWVDTVRGDA